MTGVIVFLISVLGTIISSMSGGGASIITIPVFLSLGISFPMAMAMHLLSCAFWVLPSARNYLKGRHVDWLFLILFAGLGLIGVSFGVKLITSVNERILRTVAGIMILLVVSLVYFKKELGLEENKSSSKLKERLIYLFSVPMGFYESAFGSGNGAAFSFISLHMKGLDFMKALGYYYAISFPWTVFAAIGLISKGYFDASYMVPAVAGSLIGGYAGSKYGRRKGNAFIKTVFVVVGGLLGLKLLLQF